METQVVLVTLVLLESLDPLEKLVLKDHEAVMANPVHLEEGELRFNAIWLPVYVMNAYRSRLNPLV